MGHGDGPMGHGVGGEKQPQNNHMRWLTQDGDWIFPGKQYFFCIFIHYWKKIMPTPQKTKINQFFGVSLLRILSIHTYLYFYILLNIHKNSYTTMAIYNNTNTHTKKLNIFCFIESQ